MNGVGEENGGGRGLIAGGERAVGVLKTQLLQAVTGTKVSDKRATECGDKIRGGADRRLLSTAVKTEPNLTLGGVLSSRVMRENFFAS